VKILQLFWWITSILLVNVLTGCEKRDAVLPVLTSSQSEIEAAIDELPQRLNCRRWRETDGFVYSNICCAVRQIDDKSKRVHYSVVYTNKVLGLMPSLVSARTSEQLDIWRIKIENYVDMVRWGFALLNENLPMDVNMWDYLLAPLVLIRQEIKLHKNWLTSQGTDLKHVEKNYHVRMLRDLLYNCQREISVCWYEGAKHKMSAEQLRSVRWKIKKALGELPPEMAKDDAETLTKDTEVK